MSELKVKSYCVGAMQTNCYLAINTSRKELVLIDPGDSSDLLAEKIAKSGCVPVAILLTHGHFDHAGAAEEMAKRYGVKVYAHEDEEETLGDPHRNVSELMGRMERYHADVFVRDGQTLELAGFSIRVLHTPGHTPGGCCYYIPEEDVLFSGDTLFCQSVGRTDFPGGSMSQLVRGIREKLLVLPDSTKVYPGHNIKTTIGMEKKWNSLL